MSSLLKQNEQSESELKIDLLQKNLKYIKQQYLDLVKKYNIDVVQFREMKIQDQQSQLTVDQRQFLDIKYFDFEQFLINEDQKQIVEITIKEIKMLYQQKIINLQQQINKLEQALGRSKKLIRNALDDEDLDTNMIFDRFLQKINDDPYKILYLVQETIGLENFFKSFSPPKKELKFQINYTEIQQHLKLNGIVENIINTFVKENQTIIVSLMDQLETSKKDLRQFRQDAETNQRVLEEKLKLDNQKKYDNLYNDIYNDFKERESKVIMEYDKKITQIHRLYDNVEGQKVISELKQRFYLMQWYCCTKMINLKNKFKKIKDQQNTEKAQLFLQRFNQFDLELGGDFIVKQKISQCFSMNSEAKQDLEFIKNEIFYKREIEDLKNKNNRIQQALDLERAKKDTEHFQVINLKAQIQNLRQNYEKLCQGLGVDENMLNPNKKKILSAYDKKNQQLSIQQKVKNLDKEQQFLLKNQLNLIQLTDQHLSEKPNHIDRGMNTRIMGIYDNLGTLEEMAKQEFENEEQDIFFVRKYKETEDVEVQTDEIEFENKQTYKFDHIQQAQTKIKQEKQKQYEEKNRDYSPPFQKLYEDAKSKDERLLMFQRHMRQIEKIKWKDQLENKYQIQNEDDEEIIKKTMQLLNQHKILKNRSYLQSKNKKDFYNSTLESEENQENNQQIKNQIGANPRRKISRSQTPVQQKRTDYKYNQNNFNINRNHSIQKENSELELKNKFLQMKERVQFIQKGKIRLKTELEQEVNQYIVHILESPIENKQKDLLEQQENKVLENKFNKFRNLISTLDTDVFSSKYKANKYNKQFY